MGLNPFGWFTRWVNWFEVRGMYTPGEDAGSMSPWRDFGWLIAAWLVTVGLFVVLFAVAG
jgi:hypothetical protein